MTWEVVLSNQTQKFLRSLKDAERVLEKLRLLKENPYSLPYEKLRGYENIYRVRVGKYRAIYEIDKNQRVVCILRIEKRGRAYQRI